MDPQHLPLASYTLSISHNPLDARAPQKGNLLSGSWLADAQQPAPLPAPRQLQGGRSTNTPPTPSNVSRPHMRQPSAGAAVLSASGGLHAHVNSNTSGHPTAQVQSGLQAAAEAEPEPRPSPRLVVRPYEAAAGRLRASLPQPQQHGSAQLLFCDAAADASARQEGVHGTGSGNAGGTWQCLDPQQQAGTGMSVRLCSASAASPGSHHSSPHVSAAWAAKHQHLQQHQRAPLPSNSNRHSEHVQTTSGKASSPHGLYTLPGKTLAAGGSAAGNREYADDDAQPRLGSPVRAGRMHVLPAAAAGVNAGVNMHQQQQAQEQQEQQEALGFSPLAPEEGELASLGPASLALRLQQQRPGSPRVAADVALSHLALLQQLSRGTLSDVAAAGSPGRPGTGGTSRRQSPLAGAYRPGTAPQHSWETSQPMAAGGGQQDVAGGVVQCGAHASVQLWQEGVHVANVVAPSPGPQHIMRPDRPDRLRASLQQGLEAAASASAALDAVEESVCGSPHGSLGSPSCLGSPQRARRQQGAPTQQARMAALRRSMDAHASSAPGVPCSGASDVLCSAAAPGGQTNQTGSYTNATDSGRAGMESSDGTAAAGARSGSLPALLGSSNADSPKQSPAHLSHRPLDPLRHSFERSHLTAASASLLTATNGLMAPPAPAAGSFQLVAPASGQLHDELSFSDGRSAALAASQVHTTSLHSSMPGVLPSSMHVPWTGQQASGWSAAGMPAAGDQQTVALHNEVMALRMEVRCCPWIGLSPQLQAVTCMTMCCMAEPT